MSECSSYEKMPSSLKKLGLSAADFSKMEKLKWVVTEKVHGANFSFVYENRVLKFAKRKQYLSWDDDFFGFQLVVNQIEARMVQLFEDLSLNYTGTKYIVYGELFGGEYPHAEVTADDNVSAIQTGVYYSPSVRFCAFDIAIEKDSASSKYYVDYETAVSYFKKHNVLHAQPLLIGKLGDALNFNTRINSTLPKQLSLPELTSNLIEGVVIKPFDRVEAAATSLRPILKLKNKEFDEQTKFHEAKKWSYIPNVSSKAVDLGFILDELNNYITQHRLESAISKIGALNIHDTQRLKEIETECAQDVLIDFNEDNDDFLTELSQEDNAWVFERVSSEIRKLIHKVGDVTEV